MPARPPPRRRPSSRAALLSRRWHGWSPGACAFRRPLVAADSAGEPPQPVKVGGARWPGRGPPGGAGQSAAPGSPRQVPAGTTAISNIIRAVMAPMATGDTPGLRPPRISLGFSLYLLRDSLTSLIEAGQLRLTWSHR